MRLKQLVGRSAVVRFLIVVVFGTCVLTPQTAGAQYDSGIGMHVFEAKAQGDAVRIPVIGASPWDVVEVPSWISVSPMSGDSTAIVDVRVSPNASALRVGDVVFRIGTQQHVLTVRQTDDVQTPTDRSTREQDAMTTHNTQEVLTWQKNGGIDMTSVVVTYSDFAARREDVGSTSGLQLVPMHRQMVTPQSYAQLRANPNVVRITEDKKIPMSTPANDPISVNGQTKDYGIDHIQAPQAWQAGLTGKGVRVCVVDTGVDVKHEDVQITKAVSVVGGSQTTDYADRDGHGTHVAGIIGARDNDRGVVGVAPQADIIAVKVLNDDGLGSTYDMMAGIEWCIINKAHVINMSLVGPLYFPSVQRLIDIAEASNIAIVAAAGNDGCYQCEGYPARNRFVVAVGATDRNDRLAPWSNYGDGVRVTAPGVHILSTMPGNTYAKASGTSMAAPYVSGIMALLRQQCMDCSVATLRQRLYAYAEDKGTPGWDVRYGHGRVRAPVGTMPPITQNTADPTVLYAPPALIVSKGTHAQNISVRWQPFPNATAYEVGYGRLGDTAPLQGTVRQTTSASIDVSGPVEASDQNALLPGEHVKIFVRPIIQGNEGQATWTYGVGFVKANTNRASLIVGLYNALLLRDPTTAERQTWVTDNRSIADVRTHLMTLKEYARVADAMDMLRGLFETLDHSLWDVGPYVDGIRTFVDSTDPKYVDAAGNLVVHEVVAQYEAMFEQKAASFAKDVQNILGFSLLENPEATSWTGLDFINAEAMSWIASNHYASDFQSNAQFPAITEYVRALKGIREVSTITDGVLQLLYPEINTYVGDYMHAHWANTDVVAKVTRWLVEQEDVAPPTPPTPPTPSEHALSPQTNETDRTFVELDDTDVFPPITFIRAEITLQPANWKKFPELISADFFVHPGIDFVSMTINDDGIVELVVEYPMLKPVELKMNGTVYNVYNPINDTYSARTAIALPSEGGQRSFVMHTNRPHWRILDIDSDWVDVDRLEGTDADALAFIATPNTTGVSRYAKVFLALNKAVHVIQIQQAAQLPTPPSSPPPSSPAPSSSPPSSPPPSTPPNTIQPVVPSVTVQPIAPAQEEKKDRLSLDAVTRSLDPNALLGASDDRNVRAALATVKNALGSLSSTQVRSIGETIAKSITEMTTKFDDTKANQKTILQQTQTLLEGAHMLIAKSDIATAEAIALDVIRATQMMLPKTKRFGRANVLLAQEMRDVVQQVLETASTVPIAPSPANGIAHVQWNEQIAKEVATKAASALRVAQRMPRTEAAVQNVVYIDVKPTQEAQSVKATLPMDALNAAMQTGIEGVVIQTPKMDVTVNKGVEKEAKMITLSVESVRSSSALRGSASQAQHAVQLNATVVDQSGKEQAATSFDAPLEVRIPYVPRDALQIDVTHVRFTDAQGKTSSLPARYDTKTSAWMTKVDRPGTFVVTEATTSFADVPTNHWAYDSVTRAQAKGMIVGNSKGEFGVNDVVTRAQFAKMIVYASGLSIDEQPTLTFSDTNNAAWYAPYVAAAVRAGVIQGYPDGTFSPNAPITREQMAVMMAKVMPRIADVDPVQSTDALRIQSYALPSVSLMVHTGVMSTDNKNNILPRNKVTRGEVAVAMVRLFPLVYR
ncbi:MAG: S8 family serine peptidase [Paenibacillaceae bacterium]|nr:S8 family serine peptidase [Paenibacillaceae bacterium]